MNIIPSKPAQIPIAVGYNTAVSATTATAATKRPSDAQFATLASQLALAHSPNTNDHTCAVNTVEDITRGHANTAPDEPIFAAPSP